MVVAEGQVFEYFDELRKVIETARTDVFFVDPYLDAEFVSRYLPYVAEGVSIRLLGGPKKRATLLPAVDSFAQQSGRPVAVRVSDGLHVYWFSVKMTARLDVNATPGGRMSPIAPGIVPECSGASRVKRAARAGFAALDAPCALWYSMLVGERERSGAPGIRVFMRAPCSHRAHAAASEPARVCGLAPTRSGWPCHP